MTFGRPAAIPDCYVKLDLPAFQGRSEVLSIGNETDAHNSIRFFNATVFVLIFSSSTGKQFSRLTSGSVHCTNKSLTLLIEYMGKILDAILPYL